MMDMWTTSLLCYCHMFFLQIYEKNPAVFCCFLAKQLNIFLVWRGFSRENDRAPRKRPLPGCAHRALYIYLGALHLKRMITMIRQSEWWSCSSLTRVRSVQQSRSVGSQWEGGERERDDDNDAITLTWYKKMLSSSEWKKYGKTR